MHMNSLKARDPLGNAGSPEPGSMLVKCCPHLG